MASTEGDSDSKNGDSPPSSLGNPLPDGSDRTQRDGGNQSGGTKGSASGGGLGKTSLPLSCEISTVVLRLALPGVSSPVEVVVSQFVLLFVTRLLFTKIALGVYDIFKLQSKFSPLHFCRPVFV